MKVMMKIMIMNQNRQTLGIEKKNNFTGKTGNSFQILTLTAPTQLGFKILFYTYNTKTPNWVHFFYNHV